eukprot:s56_g18.t1
MSLGPRLRRRIASRLDSLRCFASLASPRRDEALNNRQLTFALSNLGRARRWAEAAARLLEAEKRGQLVPDAIAYGIALVTLEVEARAFLCTFHLVEVGSNKGRSNQSSVSPNLAVNPAPPAEGAENWSLDGGWKPVRKSWAEQTELSDDGAPAPAPASEEKEGFDPQRLGRCGDVVVFPWRVAGQPWPSDSCDSCIAEVCWSPWPAAKWPAASNGFHGEPAEDGVARQAIYDLPGSVAAVEMWSLRQELAACAINIMNIISSYAWISQFTALAVSDCQVGADQKALCAADISDMVAALTNGPAAGIASTSDCADV